MRSNQDLQDPAFPAAHDPFVRYYESASLSAESLARFRGIMRVVLLVLERDGNRIKTNTPLTVADIGSNTGTQSMLWSEQGHRVYGLEINEGLLAIARERARERGLDIHFEHGSATALPWPDASMDVCLLPEVLEHVLDWKAVMDEACRVVKPGGVFYLSTTNVLCPVQHEFGLPGYSWYPPPLKRYFERKAVTTWPSLVAHATYPAVHWFHPYQLRRYLRARGFTVHDRFDTVDGDNLGAMGKMVLSSIRAFPPLRLLAHMLTSYTALVAIRSASATETVPLPGADMLGAAPAAPVPPVKLQPGSARTSQ